MSFVGGNFSYKEAGPGEDGIDCDWWLYEELQWPADPPVGRRRRRPRAGDGQPDHLRRHAPGLLRPEGAPRGHGRQLGRGVASASRRSRASAARRSWRPKDKELSDLCVKAYNDWMFDEWCGGSGGRLIPLPIIQLWDAELAAEEVRRNAARGGHAVCFTEIPPFLGLPSVHTDVLGPALRRLRRDRDGRVHAHRIVVEDAVDVEGRARRGRLDAHVHERGDVAHRLPDVGRVRAVPDPRARVLRGPDRLDPVHPRAGRHGVGGEPRRGAASPTR